MCMLYIFRMPSIFVLVLLFLLLTGIPCGNSFVFVTNTGRGRVPHFSTTSTFTIDDDDDDAAAAAGVPVAVVLLDEILQVAIDASKKAGAIILSHANGAAVTERKANYRDLLTLIDPICEQVRTVHGPYYVCPIYYYYYYYYRTSFLHWTIEPVASDVPLFNISIL